MPIDVGLYGTNSNGSASQEFCKYCFEKGMFREPNITLDDMIGRSIANMIDDLHMPRDQAENLATAIIPTLKRWQKVS
jgi:hypothetical protein